jgi:hypothetical protein
LRTHAKWHHPGHKRVEESNIEHFDKKVDGERFGPSQLLVSRLVGHDCNGQEII